MSAENNERRYRAVKNGEPSAELEPIVKRLAPRWFVVRNAHVARVGPILLVPRDTWSMMRGPVTRGELRVVRQWREQGSPVPEAKRLEVGAAP